MEKNTTLLQALLNVSKEDNKGITCIKKKSEEVFISYSDLYKKALAVTAALQQSGIKKMQELILQVEEIEDFLYIFWGCILGGIIPIPVSIGINDEQILKVFKILNVLNSPHLAINRKKWLSLKDFADRNNLSEEADKIEKYTFFYEEMPYESSHGEIHECTPEEIAFIQFSSGSTGTPKGVVLTHENLLANINDMITGIEITDQDSSLSWMPLTHDMGLIGFHLTPLVYGINQYIMPTSLFIRTPLLWMEKASTYRNTILSSPNFGYKYLLYRMKKANDYNFDLSNVRLIFNGAEPIAANLCIEFIERMKEFKLSSTSIFPVYGLAEASLAVTFPPLNRNIISINLDRNKISVGDQVVDIHENHKNAVSFVELGYPLQNCYIRICDDEKKDLSDNCVGHIQIKGGNVTKGYYNNKTATDSAITEDGWLDTGDLGFLREGRLVVTGRAKDIIFIGGQNYYPHDIERISEDLEEIELGTIAVCGVYSSQHEAEEIIAFVIFKKKIESFIPIGTKLKNYIFFKMGLHISQVIPVIHLPKTTSGKLQRYALKESFLKGEFDEIIQEIKHFMETNKPEGMNNCQINNGIENTLLGICREVLDTQSIGVHDNFFEFGGNSIMLTQIHAKIDTQFNGKISIADLFTYPSIRKLAQYIQDQITPSLEGISLPREYFEIEDTKKQELIVYNISDEQYQSLIYISREESIEDFDILASIYAILLNKISGSNNIYIHMFHGASSSDIIPIKIDFSHISSVIDVFSLINKTRKKSEYVEHYSLKEMNGLTKVEDKYGIIPFIYEGNIDNQDKLLDFYDMVIGIDRSSSEAKLSFQFINGKIKKEKMKNFINMYFNFIEVLIKKYKSVKEGVIA